MTLYKKLNQKIATIIVFGLLISNSLFACSSFVLSDSSNLLFGRNYDFPFGKGFVTINKKGVNKQAIVNAPFKPVRWISKYGSITFNQVGIDAPMDGMNEKGLVIAQMGLAASQYPKTNPENTINQLEWIQYQLDMSATLDEVIENNRNISIVPVFMPVHYLICDKDASVGVIEFCGGELKVYKGDDIEMPVCSNMFFDESMEKLKAYKSFGGDQSIPEKSEKVVINDEFIMNIVAKACKMIKAYKKQGLTNSVEYSFNILNAIGLENRTQWSVVYDINNLSVRFKSLKNKEIRIIDLKQFNFSCDNSIQVMDIQESKSNTGIAKQFVDFSYDDYFVYKIELNNLYKENFNGFPGMPDSYIKAEVAYAMNRKCNSSPQNHLNSQIRNSI